MSLPFESASNFGKHAEYGVSNSDLIRQVSIRRTSSDQHLPRVRNQGYRTDTFFGRLRNNADRFRTFLSTTICNCFNRVPSVFLVILAILVIAAMISSIPLAFIYSQSSDDDTTDNSVQLTTTIASDVTEDPLADVILPSVNTSINDQTIDERTPAHAFVNRTCLESSLMVNVQCGNKSYPKKFACSGYFTECKGHCDKCDEELAFNCGNGVCISKKFVCDGRDDCENGADEVNCSCDGKQMCQAKTPSGYSKCFDEDQRCDGINDCPDGQDERDCVSCNNPQGFYCKNSKKCLASIKRCDGIEDCADGDDEVDCSCDDCKYKIPMYGCSSAKRCFRMDQVCREESNLSKSKCPNATNEDELFCKSRSYLGRGSKPSSAILF